jgi:hypothetical protein
MQFAAAHRIRCTNQEYLKGKDTVALDLLRRTEKNILLSKNVAEVLTVVSTVPFTIFSSDRNDVPRHHSILSLLGGSRILLLTPAKAWALYTISKRLILSDKVNKEVAAIVSRLIKNIA